MVTASLIWAPSGGLSDDFFRKFFYDFKMAASWEEVRDILRSWREDNVRQSEEIVEYWETCLEDHIHKLGDEKWMVYEQLCLAAYDCHRIDIANICLEALTKKFPDSIRVCNLVAIRHEVEEKYSEALDMYDRILKRDKTNLLAQKRKTAILKSQGKIPEAIKELTEYLKKFMSDQEAWLELCELYIQEQDYTKAAFCMEEVILFSPHNHLYHQRYAEIRYTQGGPENVELARSYFSQAVKLNPNNLRALYGLFLAASSTASSPKCPALKKKENQKYAAWAAKQITDKYQNPHITEDGKQVKAVENMLSSLQIAGTH